MASFQLQNSEVLARLKPFGISFEKSLNDLIKGIRSHSKESAESLSEFLDLAIQECKTELTTTDLETKAMAVLKLAYLEMYGFDMSWCNFQILEVMSSSRFQQKRIGYLAAIQSFKNEQDLLILATNQFKKDLNSHNHVEIGLALSGIATIVTPNLSKDINDDVLMKLSHSKPYIRKKAILAMYKIFLQFPDSLRLNFNRIIAMLDDSDVSVVSATLNVICELSKKNPNIFINYLPKFFSILEETKNNWLIIRILKLFQSLSKVEPRMKKKILPTIIDLMLRTQASSLIYECINCIVNGQMLNIDSSKDKETAKLCIKQIMEFFKTKDSNLKFVGLIALINVLKIFPVFIHKVDGVSEVIMDCITDPDLIIKRKALEICHFLVKEDNIVEVVKTLLVQLIPSENSTVPESLKQEIMQKIIFIATQDNYSNIPNFKWYIAVLKDIINLTLLPLPSTNTTAISQVTASIIAAEVGKEFKNLATKVPSIRSDILNRVIVDAVKNPRILDVCPTLLKDFYWILGEYIDELKTDDEIITVLIQALVKLFSSIVSDYNDYYSKNGTFSEDKYNQVAYYLYKLIQFLNNWENHIHFEVQERALSWLEFLKLSLEAMIDGDNAVILKLETEEDKSLPMLLTHILPSFFKSYQLNPVSKNSQRKIGIPEDLDLDTPINPIDYQLEDFISTDVHSEEYNLYLEDDLDEVTIPLGNLSNSSEDSVRKRQERLERLKDDPYYLTSSNGDRSNKSRAKKPLLMDESKDSSIENFSERATINSNVPPSPPKKKKSTKTKTKTKSKRDKVIILAEETIEGGDDDNDEDMTVSKSKKSKRNILKIDSSNLDNFDLNSVATPDDSSLSNNKGYEYDIDLEELRKQLAESAIKKTEKEEKKKKKKKEKEKEKKTVPTKTSSCNHTDLKLEHDSDLIGPSNDNSIVTVVKSKKSKKKSKAAIIE
ncbi:adaptin N terminal region-domain-containing protein [Scheffersomyces amazonensis]|uniref:adaptin N terminal region-domain-containing protein n=1 Tax=Scheffersomyces amazonensis TaxID=1078765 RepID=UPI00315D7406